MPTIEATNRHEVQYLMVDGRESGRVQLSIGSSHGMHSAWVLPERAREYAAAILAAANEADPPELIEERTIES